MIKSTSHSCKRRIVLLLFVLTCFKTTVQACSDSASWCDQWLLFCNSSSIMKESCKKSCNFCSTGGTDACSDSASWCDQGLSLCNSWSIMKESCKKSCNFCSSTGGTDDSWSSCTKTCGSGTKFKDICNGGTCKREYEACSTQNCQRASCSGYLNSLRYGIQHACCSGQVLSSDSSCGNPQLNSPPPPVVGGVSAQHKRWPWTAALKWNKQFLCSSVLVSSSYLVTAAHCVRGYQASGWRAHLGILRLGDSQTGTGISQITEHPSFSPSTFQNDIAIMKLQTPVQTSSTIQPICLPGGEITPQDTTCFVTGWGVSDHSWGTTNHLQEGAVQNLDPRICREKFALIPSMQHVMPYLNSGTGYLCAGSLHRRVDSCTGDSGGPLACQRCSSCSWMLAGIVSFGNPTSCGETPGVYTRIRDYEYWIASVTSMTKHSVTCGHSIGP